MNKVDRQKVAKQIVDAIVSDITDRSGLGNEFESIDDDVKDEIKAEWQAIIAKKLENAGA